MSHGLVFERNISQKSIQEKLQPSFLKELWDYVVYFIVVFICVGILYTVIRTSVFDVIGVAGVSMYPTYEDGDGIYLDQLTPKFGRYERGEVIVMLSPISFGEERELFIKRIIGLPGETLVFENGIVYVFNENYPKGIILDESAYLKENVKTFKNIVSDGTRYETAKLADNEYYVMGDNRTQSTDSRTFGPVTKVDILGREFYRILPAAKSGFWKDPPYNIEG